MGNTILTKSKAYQVPVFITIVLGLILFLTAGSLSYWPGWIFWTIISALTMFITTPADSAALTVKFGLVRLFTLIIETMNLPPCHLAILLGAELLH